MIRVRGMRKSYRTGKVVNEVLRGVDLDVEEGEFVAIIGPSGSGKTTLLHTIGGLDTHYEGRVEVDGRDLRDMNDLSLSAYRNEKVGFVFQQFYLLPHLTCLENVALPSIFARGNGTLDHRAATKRAREVLEQVDLADKLHAPPTTLSGGQRQRVAIARALFNRPRLMLCDEPTGNLDSKMGAAIMDLFRRLNAEESITVLVVTHDPKIASSTARRIQVADGLITDDAARAPAPATESSSEKARIEEAGA